MAHATPPTSLGQVTLVTGTEEFLAERAVPGCVDAVRAADPEAEVTETAAAELGPGSLAELTEPVAVRERRARGRARARRGARRGVTEPLACAAQPGRRHRAGPGARRRPEGQGMLDKLRKARRSPRSRSEAPKAARARRGSPAAEVRRPGGRIDEDAAEALVDAVGTDLRALAGGRRTAGHDFPGEPITAEHVRRYFGGRAEVKGFAVADAAIERPDSRGAGAAALGAEQRRQPVLVTSASRAGCGRWRGRRGAARAARGRPGPRGRRTPVEAPARCAARLRGWGAQRPRRRPIRAVAARRRRRQGRRPADPGVRARSGWCSRSAARHAPGADGTGRRHRPRTPTAPPPGTGDSAVPGRAGRGPWDASRVRRAAASEEAARLVMADLRFAAWFLWMTPADAALSSLRSARAASRGPRRCRRRRRPRGSWRTAVFSADFTDLLRSCAASFCRLRLIWDLMFATGQASGSRSCGGVSGSVTWRRARPLHSSNAGQQSAPQIDARPDDRPPRASHRCEVHAGRTRWGMMSSDPATPTK